ncbi:sodium-dependent glucose transporter 1C-like [Saccostrea echinata]|uniref:sodium-dependent glucose transporter 1C-like n=1 Tax=Saccostrea echinata TaxID=191078 RepID=UPI002A7FCC09|nr:sodium-dependent glucose transporter 1C-like [Saccostrea echinata]
MQKMDDSDTFKAKADHNDRSNDTDLTISWATLKQDKLFKNKFILTLAYIVSYFAEGWIEGQFGPTFPDLLFITNTSMKQGSIFFNMYTAGFLLGCVVMGLLFDKGVLDGNLLTFLTTMGFGIINAVIPWCGLYEIMIILHILKGMFGGGLDTCANAALMATWGNKGDIFFNVLHFSFAFGGILSPLSSAPYVMSQEDIYSFDNKIISCTLNNNTYDPMSAPNLNNFSDVLCVKTMEKHQTSRIFIPYSISTCLCILTSFPFLLFFRMSLQKILDKEKAKEEIEHTKRSQKRLRVAGFINMTVYVGVYYGIVDTFAGFLTTFIVSELKWTNSEGNYLTSGHWTLFAAARFLGIFLVNCISPVKMIFIYNLLMLISLFGFLITSLYDVTIGIWLFTCLLGFALSVIFPTVVMWTEMKFVRVTGKVASIFLVAASIGSSVNPPVLGILMENFTPMWFSYLLLAETVVLIVLYFTGLSISRRITTKVPYMADQDHTISMCEQFQD